MTIIEISVAAIAVAFVGLVIYLILLIKDVRFSLKSADKLLSKTVERTDLISLDLLDKMSCLDSVFSTVSNIGDYLEKKSEILKQEAVACTLAEKMHREEESLLNEKKNSELIKFAEIADIISAGARLWQKFKKGSR